MAEKIGEDEVIEQIGRAGQEVTTERLTR